MANQKWEYKKDEKLQELFKSNKEKFVQNVSMNRFINGSKFLRER